MNEKAEILEVVKALVEDGQVEAGRDLIKDYLSVNPNDCEGISIQAVIAIMQGDFALAESVLKKGLTYEPSHNDLCFNWAYLLEMKGENLVAIEKYRELSQREQSPEMQKAMIEAEVRLAKVGFPTFIKKKKRIIFFVKAGLDSFLSDIMNGLADEYEVRKAIVQTNLDIDEGMLWADICWFEWCDELIIYASNLKMIKGKRIFCRLHSYEAFTEYPTKVNWNNVEKVIFVAEHIRDFVLEKASSLNQDKTVIISNGIDFSKYSFMERKLGFNIAYLGYINYKKGPMLLLHTFKAIYDKDHRYKLYIAGTFQDDRDILYYRQMITEMGLEKNVFYDGWQDHVDKWLEDKDYLISTSVLEGQPLGIMEAMAKGIKPLIHNFVGARGIYLGKYIWNTIPECVKMVCSKDYNSNEYRIFIKENYSIQHQIGEIHKLFDNGNCDGHNQSEVGKSPSLLNETANYYEQENRVKDYYNKFVDYLKNDREKENPRHIYLKNRLATIIKKGDRILDLGCGIGITSEHILSIGASRVVGVDLSDASINYAKQTVKGVEFMVHDITTFSINEKFDAVVLCDCMEHIPAERYSDLFKVIRKHVKEDGIVYISIPDPEYMDFVREKRPDLLQIIDNSIYYAEIEKLCEQTGLHVAFYNAYSVFVGNEYNEYILRTKEEYNKKWETIVIPTVNK